MSADLQVHAGAPAPGSMRLAVSAVDPATRPQRSRPLLALVPGSPNALGRAPFIGLLVLLMAAGLLGLLALNTALAGDAFRRHTLTEQGQQLQDREQELRREVERLNSPQRIAERARSMGMVVSGPPAFLRLPDGTILGAPEAAVPPADPTAGPSTAGPSTAHPGAPPAPAVAAEPAAGTGGAP